LRRGAFSATAHGRSTPAGFSGHQLGLLSHDIRLLVCDPSLVVIPDHNTLPQSTALSSGLARKRAAA
jgi:hypothetical protein